MVSLSSEFLDLVTVTVTVMTVRQIEKLGKFVNFLEVSEPSNWHKEYVVRIIVRPRDGLRSRVLRVTDRCARLHAIIFHARCEVVADVGSQGVFLAVPGLFLLHITERTSANPDLRK